MTRKEEMDKQDAPIRSLVATLKAMHESGYSHHHDLWQLGYDADHGQAVPGFEKRLIRVAADYERVGAILREEAEKLTVHFQKH